MDGVLGGVVDEGDCLGNGVIAGVVEGLESKGPEEVEREIEVTTLGLDGAVDEYDGLHWLELDKGYFYTKEFMCCFRHRV